MPKIQIENVRTYDQGRALMKANVIIDGQIKLIGCRLVQLDDKQFVSMPQVKGNDSKWYDQAKIIDSQLSDEIHKAMQDALATIKGQPTPSDQGANREVAF